MEQRFNAVGRATRPGRTSLGLTTLLLTELIATASGSAARLSYTYSAMPGTTNTKVGSPSDFAQARGGRMGILTLELEDAFDAIQVGAVNQFTSPWGVARIVAAPSASYGGDISIGAAPYDLDGAPITQMLPVQWAHGGADSAAPGDKVVALVTAASAAAGQTQLRFASTIPISAYGGARPGPGWSVADGTGCVPAGATVQASDPTSVTLSAPVRAPGCAVGQAIYFAPAPLGPFAQAIPAAATFGHATFTLSDWLPLRSLPRTDGGFTIGATVSGDGVAGGTKLVGVTDNAIKLSRPLAGRISAQARVDVSVKQSLAAAAGAGAVSLDLADTGGVRPGQTVSGTGIAPATHVAGVSAGTVALAQPTTGPIAAGTGLTFANAAWIVLPAQAGATSLRVPSTSDRPLLHLRYFTQGGPSLPVTMPGCVRDPTNDTLPCEAPLGLPAAWSLAAPENSSHLPIDGVNFPGRVGGGASRAARLPMHPTFFVRFVGRHAGATLLVCGGYQAAGAAGSVSGEAGPGRIGAAMASAASPTLPVSAFGIAGATLDTTSNFANCMAGIDTLRPNVVLLQDYSNHNGTQVAAYRADVQRVAEHALAAGAQPVIYLAYAEGTASIGALPVAGASTGTTVRLATGINRTVAGSPSLVTGPGVRPNTTARTTFGGWTLRLSQPADVPAGAILHFGLQVASTNGTRVRLSYPSFSLVKAATITAPASASGAILSVAKTGSTEATTNTAVPLQPGAVLGLRVAPGSSIANYTAAADWFRGRNDPWNRVQLDALATLATDAANPGLMCEPCTTEGSYANDYGNALIGAELSRLLGNLTAGFDPPVAR